MDDKALTKLAKLLNVQYDQFNERVNKLERYITTLSNKTYDRMDAVFKEVLAMRQEQASHVGSHERINDELEDHEKRLSKIESPRVTAH